jgi:hypothetical protein
MLFRRISPKGGAYSGELETRQKRGRKSEKIKHATRQEKNHCGPQKFRPPLRVGNSESGHEEVSLLLEVSEVVSG